MRSVMQKLKKHAEYVQIAVKIRSQGQYPTYNQPKRAYLEHIMFFETQQTIQDSSFKIHAI